MDFIVLFESVLNRNKNSKREVSYWDSVQFFYFDCGACRKFDFMKINSLSHCLLYAKNIHVPSKHVHMCPCHTGTVPHFVFRKKKPECLYFENNHSLLEFTYRYTHTCKTNGYQSKNRTTTEAREN